MAVFKVLLLAMLLCAPSISANPEPSHSEDTNLSTSISSLIVEWASIVVEYLFELFDLKMKSIRFLVSLYNDDNLHLFKRYMSLGMRVIQWLHGVLPDSTTDTNVRFLSYLFPQQNQDSENETNTDQQAVMPSLIHSLSLNDRPTGRENDINQSFKNNDKLEEINKIPEVSPFAEQVLSLDALINARSANRK